MSNANLQSLDWDHVRHFLAVVHAGSVTHAAQHLGVNQTTVSRRITALEDYLGKRLFERSGNGWLITPLGEQLVASAAQMAEEANAIERQVMADSQELNGPLRLTVADACTQHLAMPAIRAFTQRYPSVALEIIATTEELDLGARDADIALRSTDAPPPNLVGKRVAQVAYAIYGTEESLERIRTQGDPADVPCITWIGDSQTRPPWIEKNFPKTRRIYRSNGLGLMLQMVQQGLGVAQMPCAIGDPDPLLHRIPVPYVEPGWGLWVLSHVDLRTTARIRVFRDFLVSALEEKRALIEGHRP